MRVYILSVCRMDMDLNRPCKVVLLTLVASRGVTDLFPSRGMDVEHARTAYHTCSL